MTTEGVRRVLVADDDPNLRDLLVMNLTAEGFEVQAYANGEDACRNAAAFGPDLIVLDVMMPGLNGWEICKYVKTRSEYDDTGVIMLTAIGPTVNELTSPLYGADEYIDKPFDFDELEFKVRKVLADKRKQPA